MTKYQSRYSPGKRVTAAQYICELVCENCAKINKRELPLKFWQLEEWGQYFRYQMKLAHALLKQYNETAIIKAIRSTGAASLRNGKLKSAIQQHARQKPVEAPEIKPATTFRAQQEKNNPLRDLDL